MFHLYENKMEENQMGFSVYHCIISGKFQRLFRLLNKPCVCLISFQHMKCKYSDGEPSLGDGDLHTHYLIAVYETRGSSKHFRNNKLNKLHQLGRKFNPRKTCAACQRNKHDNLRVSHCKECGWRQQLKNS